MTDSGAYGADQEAGLRTPRSIASRRTEVGGNAQEVVAQVQLLQERLEELQAVVPQGPARQPGAQGGGSPLASEGARADLGPGAVGQAGGQSEQSGNGSSQT